MDKITIRGSKNAKTGLIELCEYIGLNNTHTMVEIGSYVGDSSAIFAERVEKLYCVDPWENGYDDKDNASFQYPMLVIEEQFDQNIMEKFDNVKKMKMKSEEAYKYFEDGSLDFVYIDGLHTYTGVHTDIDFWVSKVKTGSYITGHDYQERFQGCIYAINELLGEPEKVFPDTSWCVRVTEELKERFTNA